MKPNKVLVCGGRDYNDHREFANAMEWFKLKHGDITKIIHGGAKGADSLAGSYADICGIDCEVYNADWETHGKAAGIIRNQEMLEIGKPDFVIAFKGGRGTADMIKRSKDAGVIVYDVELLEVSDNIDLQ